MNYIFNINNRSSVIRNQLSVVRHKRRQLFVILLLAILAISSYQIWGYLNPIETEAAWFTGTGSEGTWKFRRELVIDQNQVNGDTDFTNFHIVINTRFPDLADHAQDDGDDIVFTSSNGQTKISHEIEVFDGDTGQMTIWVEIPTLEVEKDTTIYMYYGNPNSPNQEGVADMWGGNFAAVYHMSEDPSASAGCNGVGTKDICDSSPNGNHGDSSGSMTSGDLIESKLGKAIDFDGTDDYIDIGNDSSLDFGVGGDSDFSVIAWVKIDSTESLENIFSKNNGNLENTQVGFQLAYRGDLGDNRTDLRINDGNVAGSNSNDNDKLDIGNNDWHLLNISMDRSSDAAPFWIDGKYFAVSDINGKTGSLNVTNNGEIAGGSAWGGRGEVKVDELWLMMETHTREFAETVYNNQNSTETFFRTIGDPEIQDDAVGFWKFDESVDDSCVKPDIQYVDSASGTGTGTTVSIAKADLSGLKDNDLVVVALAHDELDGAGGSWTLSGWTFVSQRVTTAGRDINSAVAYKLITSVSSESTSWDFSLSSTGEKSASAVAVRGVDATNIIDASVVNSNGIDSTNPNAPDITTTKDYAFVVSTLHLIDADGTLNLYGGAPDELKFGASATQAGTDMAYTAIAYNTYPTPGAVTIGIWRTVPPNSTSEYNANTIAFASTGSSIYDTCDSTSGENHGELSGATWQPKEMCVSGSCLYFDGSDDVVTITNDDLIDFDTGLSDGVSVSFWIRPITDGENSTGEIFDKGSHFYCRTDTEGGGFADLECSIDLGTTDATVNITDGLTLGRWHHVEATYADDGDDNLLVYIDGQLPNSGTGNGEGAPVGTDSSNLSIGGDTSNNYHGFVDEFKIYDYQRSIEEIRTDYMIGSNESGSGVSVADDNYRYLSDGLVGYWELDETSGNASDSSGFGNTLTNNGTTTFVGSKFYYGSEHVPDSNHYFSTSTNITGIKTVSLWVNPDSNTNYLISLNSNSYITASSGTLSANGFTNSKIFVNGIESTNLTANIWQLITVTTDAQIDADQFYLGRQGSSYYDGTIDDVRLYNRTFNTSEANKIYNWGPSPIGYWPMDENQGNSTVFDRSGTGNNGTLQGGMNQSDWVPGKFGSALDFDGTNDYVSSSTTYWDGVFTESSSWTISFWVYYRDSGNRGVISHYNPSAFKGVVLRTSDVPALVFLWFDSTGSARQLMHGAPVGNWYHYTAQYDRSTDKMVSYLNGKERLELDVSGYTFDNLSNQGLYMGHSRGTASYMSGLIDDVRVYNYARTQAQVVEDMNSSNPIGDSSPIGSPVAHWKFDEGYGTVATDSATINGVENLTTATTNWTASGKYSAAFNGGDNKRASLADDNDLDFAAGEDVSISLWFKSDSATNPTANEYLLNKGPTIATDAVGYAIYTADTGGTICFGIDDDSTNFPEDSVCSASDIYDNTWHQIIAIKTANSRMDLFVDGVASGTPDTSISSTGTLANAATFYIGDGNATDGTDEFLGDIDDVKIYRAALTTDQVRVDYNAGSAINFGTGTNEATIVVDGAGNAAIGDWSLDENTGSTAYDRGGSGNDLTLTNTPTYTNGKFGSAINFAGSNQHLVRSDDSDFDFGASTAFTLEAWIKNSSLSGIETIINKLESSGTDGGFKLKMESDGDITCETDDDDANTTINDTATTTAATYDDGNWHHVVCVYDVINTDLLIYVDGVLTASDTSITTNSLANDEDLFVGIESSTGSEDWTGDIDHPKIYNYARTQGQVMYEYNRGRPIGWWRFDECSGDTLNNASGNSTYNGTRSGTGATNTSSGTCSSGTSSEAWNNGTSGRFGASLDFDADDDGTGGDDVVTVTNGSIIDFNEGLQNGITFSAWIYANTDGEANTGNIINKGANTYCRVDNQVDVVDQVNDILDLECQLDLGTDRNVNISSAITQNTWTHIAMSWSNDSDDDISVWINGVLRGSSTTNTNDTIPADTNNFYIGNNSSGSLTFDGKIDEVHLYNYALSADQIKQVYTGGAVRFE